MHDFSRKPQAFLHRSQRGKRLKVDDLSLPPINVHLQHGGMMRFHSRRRGQCPPPFDEAGENGVLSVEAPGGPHHVGAGWSVDARRR